VLTARAASKVAEVYMYRFSRVSPANQSAFGGAGHGTEIPYVFDHIPADESQSEAIDRAVSRAMAGAWVQFAKTGNPNGATLPRWPAYRSPEYKLLDYGDEISVQSNANSPNVDFFQRVFEGMRGKQDGVGRAKNATAPQEVDLGRDVQPVVRADGAALPQTMAQAKSGLVRAADAGYTLAYASFAPLDSAVLIADADGRNGHVLVENFALDTRIRPSRRMASGFCSLPVVAARRTSGYWT
jgi:hypothetical protein